MNCMFSKIFTFLKCILIAAYMEQCTEEITQSLAQHNRAMFAVKLLSCIYYFS